MPRRRCWDANIGDKSHRLCNDDPLSQRKKIGQEVSQHLEGCQDAFIDKKLTRQIDPDLVQYKVQAGSVKAVKCARRKLKVRCSDVTIGNDRIKLCTDDPLEKKVDVMDAVDGMLMGCSEGNFKNQDGSKFSMYKPRAGLDSVERGMIAREVINGQVTSVKCKTRLKKRVKKESTKENSDEKKSK